MRLAVEKAAGQQPIFFGFADRILFALETAWREPFLADLRALRSAECVIFERSPLAWSAHPDNYRELDMNVPVLAMLAEERFRGLARES